MGPKKDDENLQGVRFDAKERMTESGRSEWFFEECKSGADANGMLLVRIMIAKVAQKEQLVNILRSVPIQQEKPGWNCVAWVREALDELRPRTGVLGVSGTEWQDVRDTAMWYVEKKKSEHRFDRQVAFDMKKAATYDAIERKETVP
jgi:hypothetical protein